jgi:hypothetical protein
MRQEPFLDQQHKAYRICDSGTVRDRRGCRSKRWEVAAEREEAEGKSSLLMVEQKPVSIVR